MQHILKTLLIAACFITVLCWMVGCDSPETYKAPFYWYSYKVDTIEGCEYIETTPHFSLTHKGNCKFCTERKSNHPSSIDTVNKLQDTTGMRGYLIGFMSANKEGNPYYGSIQYFNKKSPSISILKKYILEECKNDTLPMNPKRLAIISVNRMTVEDFNALYPKTK